MNHGLVWNTYELHLRSSWKRHQRRLEDWRMLSYFPNSVTQCSLRRVTRKFWFPFIPGERSTAKDTLHWFVWILCSVGRFLACEKSVSPRPSPLGTFRAKRPQRKRARWKNGCFHRLGDFTQRRSQGPFLLAPRKGRIGEATRTCVSPTRH